MSVRIGWGRREFSMNVPASMPGLFYLRIAEGIHDPLYATALVVDGGEGQDSVIFCSCDIGALYNGIIGEVAARVRELRPEIPVDAIIMNATHTHSSVEINETPEKSPDGAEIYPGLKYRVFFIEQVSAAIVEAWDTRKEGGIGFGYGYAVAGHSRRSVYLDDVGLRMKSVQAPNGKAVMYGNTNDAYFSGYEAGADHFLNLLFTFNETQKLTGIVVNVPCPSQLSSAWTTLSADFWGDARELFAREFGEDVYILPQCAAAGDLAPKILHYKQAQARRFRLKFGLDAGTAFHDLNCEIGERRDIAERIVAGTKEVYGWAKNEILTDVPVRHIRRDVKLKRRMITEEEKDWCEESAEILKSRVPDPNTSTPEEYRVALTTYETIAKRNNRAIARFEEQDADPYIDSVIHAAQIGDIGFTTTRFELYMDFMHRIQARSPFLQTFVVQLAGNEGATYLATERAIANKGYGASLFCNQVSAEAGQQIVEESLDMLFQMKNKEED